MRRRIIGSYPCKCGQRSCQSYTNCLRVNFSSKCSNSYATAQPPARLSLPFCRFTSICLATKCFPSLRGFPTLFLVMRHAEHISRKDAMYINTQVVTGTNLNLYLSQQQMKYINLYMCDIHKTCMQYAKLSSPFPLST
jgi:hypothetical protein